MLNEIIKKNEVYNLADYLQIHNTIWRTLLFKCEEITLGFVLLRKYNCSKLIQTIQFQ